jgi:hypothetical protein
LFYMIWQQKSPALICKKMIVSVNLRFYFVTPKYK